MQEHHLVEEVVVTVDKVGTMEEAGVTDVMRKKDLDVEETEGPFTKAKIFEVRDTMDLILRLG
jgi:hypothetical protein